MATGKRSRKFAVTGGPDKFDLMLALFDDHDWTRTVDFTIDCDGQHALEVNVSAVSRFQKSEFTVTCVYGSNGAFDICYNPTTRQGTFWLEEEDWKCEICGEFVPPWEIMTHSDPGEECAWCHMFIYDSEVKQKTADGDTICQKCWDRDAQGPKIAQQRRQEDEQEEDPWDDGRWDNEDPLEGEVDPVGGHPSDREALRNFDE